MKIESFASIYQRAAERKGGADALEALLPLSLSAAEYQEHSDAALLSAMSKKIFQSGFVWKVVDAKWPAYEQAFFGFDPLKILLLSPEQLEARASDPALIRHGKKTQAIYDNALMVQDIAKEHGSLARFIALWPSEEITGLWQVLKKRGARLGGNTGPYFLRATGKDTFLLSSDVEAYLRATGLVDAGLATQKGLTQAQAAFNHWQAESGRTLAHISRVISCSVGDNYL
ncbi:DNA-3-methyladenine glycosylase I [Shewanella sp. JM162201]|uniref:DNA-3-methyladenine glycosylase I n=1 Tax=Shewanella jiangmenensis TaxID=2837387 RepID=A0ABS5V596_9GAMM|nr:DNA-3-methyladenine glycosylase I [Shewanella jiangmenensis]MBT1445133.1 DNA-3-methyladenine glycosylase I [Shewanella jiangmenensis]